MYISKQVEVLDSEQRLLWSGEVNLGGLNYRPSNPEYERVAIKLAVDDGCVNESQTSTLSVRIVEN